MLVVEDKDSLRYALKEADDRVLMALTLLTPLLTRGATAHCSSALVASGAYGTADSASGNAQYVVYLPQPACCFNGTVILYAHGYVSVGALTGTWLSQLQLPDGTNIPSLVNGLGFGFAASSYSRDGLAVLQGIRDTKAMVNVLHGLKIPFGKVFITGASEGGLVTTKSVESDPSYARGSGCVRTNRQLPKAD